MREIDLEAEVISGLDEGKPQRPLTTPALPVVDDPLSEFEANSGLADATIAELEANEFTGEVCGLDVSEVRKIVARESEPLTLSKTLGTEKRTQELNARFERLIFREINSALIPIKATVLVEARKADLAKGDGARRAVLTKMLRPLRSLFRTPPEARFERLTDVMAAFVLDRIVDEA
jgi:hypothetical protein